MNWLLLAIIAYFFYAVVFIGDRILVTKAFKQPIAYAFYTGLLHSAAILLIPFVLFFSKQQLFPNSSQQWIVDFLAGAFFLIAIYFLYRALYLFETSQIIPLVGGIIPIFSLLFSIIFLAEFLNSKQLLAFCFLLIGSILISLKKEIIFSVKCFLAGIITALFFGIFYTLSAYIYLTQSFWSGFIWARVGTAVSAILLLILPAVRKLIFQSSEAVKNKIKVGGFLVGIHSLGALAFLLIQYSISLAPVSLVNALQGIQYIWLLILVFFLAKKFPQLLSEEITSASIIQKTLAIILISIGLVILAYV